MKTEDLSGLKAGPLAGQDLSLLKAGSVVWSQTRNTLCVVQDIEPDVGLHVRWWVAEDGVQLCDVFEAFSYIGERGEDGWISWSGGENPVPGMVVDIRVTGDYEYAVASDDWDWDFEPDPIIAFRAVASDHSPSAQEADPHRLAETGVVSGPGDYAPWAAEWIEENSDWCVMGAEQMDLEGDCYTPSICTLSDWVSGKEAALMAAAPDLLEACQNMSGLYDTPVERRRRGDDPLYAEAVKHLRAAVEKATAANSLGTPECVKPKAQPSITKGGDL